MSLEKEGRMYSEEGSKKFDAVIKKPKFSYPRELLLSLSDLDICKKLPNGFDESLLSEFEDAAQIIQDRPRIPGSHPLQGFRKNQYGSSPPTRGDSSNYSRGSYGKWEGRSSGRSDRDSDSQSDRDSDSGRRYGHPSRRSWQSPEHDGLLGSGSFPRPSGHVSGIYTPKFRTHEDSQLSKSNEPYHPPRPYKGVPYSRRDTDSFNDETFGSVECDNEDRVQEERKRRASFEMIRKEQQKALQEKQKLSLEKHKSAVISNLSEVLEDKKEEMGPSAWKKELEASAATVASSNTLDSSSFSSQAPASRPLVPPGFNNSILEKSSVLKHDTQTPLLEEQKPLTGENLLDNEVNFVCDDSDAGLEQRSSQEINIVNGKPSEKVFPFDKGENVKSLYSSDVHVKKPVKGDLVPHASIHLDSHETLDDRVNSYAFEDKTVGEANRKFSTSILQKIFGGALSINDDGSNSAESHLSKPEDTWSHNSVQSSKFAQWFFEEEAKSTDDISSGRSNELLSLISGSNKDQCQVSDSEAANFQPDFSFEQSNKLTLGMPPGVNGITDQACDDKKDERLSAVITCEDLEQSMLTEYSAKSSSIKPLSEGWNATILNTKQTSEHVDDHASLHLLSLLQKGSIQSIMKVNSDVGHNLEDKPIVSQEHDMNIAVHEHKHEEDGKSTPNLGKTITLEALFGSAFMKELQSVEAPVSVRSNESNEVSSTDSLGLSFPVAGSILPSSATDINGLQGSGHNQGLLASNDNQMRPSVAEKWLGLGDSGDGTILANDHLEEVSKHDGFGTVEFQPPEMNIYPETDPLSHRMLACMPTHNSVNSVGFSPNGRIELLDKLGAINAIKDDRVVTESLPFTHLPYRNLDPQLPYPGLQVQQPSPEFQPPQMAQLGPLHNNFESPLAHMSSQMKFLGSDPMFNHHSLANQQFPSNMVQRPLLLQNAGIAGLDVQALASMQHQMQLSGNHSHLVPDFPRGGPLSHAGNQGAGLPIPGIIPAPGLNSGHNPPEFFPRLIEMGVQANSKHIRPSAPGYNQGLNSHGVDMGFQYR